MKFVDLGLAEPIVRAVAAEGYTSPTPIQAQAIPVALEGHDLLGCAQTGTGKTCAFALPILHRLVQSTDGGKGRKAAHGRAPRALILCPTRELASQIFDSFVAYGRNLPLRHAVIFGGVNQHRQVQALRSGVDVLIATPGRLLDLINQGFVDLREVETLVLDEADRMLDMGFIHDIRKIVRLISTDRQTLLFSATMSQEIRKLASSILRDPIAIETARESATADAIAQQVYMIARPNKPELLQHLIHQDQVGRTLVFTRTKHGADKLVKILHRYSINADAIHGNKTQNARTRAMQAFRSGKTSVLVATDIAARGIDVDEITHVFNYDMPVDAETYVHRIGRTARAGSTGIAISLCDKDEVKTLRAIERRTQQRIEVVRVPTDLPTGPSTGSAATETPQASHHADSAPQRERGRPRPQGHNRQNGERSRSDSRGGSGTRNATGAGRNGRGRSNSRKHSKPAGASR